MTTDKSPPPVIQKTDNLKALRASIAAGYAKIKASMENRGEANAEIAEVLAGLETQGVSKKPMRMAIQYIEMTEDQRAGFDIAYQIAREALGAPLQADMFGAE